MIELTDEQESQIKGGGWPPRAVNRTTREEFVLIHAALFERVRHILEAEDEITAIEEMYPTITEALDRDESVSRESA